jgi:excisionase family DNA binding protein
VAAEPKQVEPLLYSVLAVAVQLSLSPVTVRKMCRDGRIQSILIGDRRLISREELHRIASEGASRPSVVA